MHKYCHISFDRLFMCHPFHGFRFFFYGFEWFPHRCPDASTHSLLLCRPAIRRGSHLAAPIGAGNFLRYARRAFFTMGDSPFFTTSASEFFIPLARAVFTTSNASSSPPRTIPMPSFMSPACWSTPAGAAVGVHIFFYATRGSRPSLLLCRPAIRRGYEIPSAPCAASFLIVHCTFFNVHCTAL